MIDSKQSGNEVAKVADARRHPSLCIGRLNSLVVILALIVSAVGLFVHAAWLATHEGDAWQTGDWLISYAGGYVRRGLVGELIALWSTDGAQVLWWVFAFQYGSYVVLAAVVVGLFLGTTRSAAWVIVVLSPAFMLFPSMNPVGGMRKELLVLVAIALMGLVVRFGLSRLLAVVAVLVFAIAAFSHESGALMIPVLLYLMWRGAAGGVFTKRFAFALGGFVSAISLSALISAALFPGNSETAARICSSWVSLGVRDALCGGPIEYLAVNSGQARAEVLGLFPGYWAYLPLALLALVPLILVGVRRKVWVLALITYVASAPLFLLGIDYGRWIFLATSALSLIALATWQLDDFQELPISQWTVFVVPLMWSLNYSGGASQNPFIARLFATDYSAMMDKIRLLIEHWPQN